MKWPDTHFVKEFALTDHPVVGGMTPTGLWPAKSAESLLAQPTSRSSVPALLASNARANRSLVARMERQSREAHLSGNSDRLAAELAVCSRSIRGVDVKATAEGPLSLSELDRRHGHHGYRSAMRFGVDEGLDEAGDTKWRP